MLALGALWRDESGAQLVEYILLATLVAIVCFISLQTIGNNLSTIFNNTAATV